MSWRRLHPFARALPPLFAITCGGQTQDDEHAGGETSDFGNGSGGVAPQGEYCTIEVSENLGGAGGALDCSSLEVASSGCPVAALENTSNSTGGARNGAWTLTEGTYLLGSVSVHGESARTSNLIGREFEGTLVVRSSGATDFVVESDIKSPRGHFAQLSSWHFEDDQLTPTVHCGDPETFLGFPVSEYPEVIYGHGEDAFSFPFLLDAVGFDLRFVRAGTGIAPRHPL